MLNFRRTGTTPTGATPVNKLHVTYLDNDKPNFIYLLEINLGDRNLI